MWRCAAVVGVAILATTIGADARVPTGPLGAKQTQWWHVTALPCLITQSWQKKPGALTVGSIAFNGAVSCGSVPSNLSIFAEIQVFDLTHPLAAAQIDTWRGMGPSDTPESIALSGELTAPKTGHSYLYYVYVSFIENNDPWSVNGVHGTPPQCTTNNIPPFSDGPPSWLPPSVDCTFTQVVTVL